MVTFFRCFSSSSTSIWVHTVSTTLTISNTMKNHICERMLLRKLMVNELLLGGAYSGSGWIRTGRKRDVEILWAAKTLVRQVFLVGVGPEDKEDGR
jgi:hypothetical protein